MTIIFRLFVLYNVTLSGENSFIKIELWAITLSKTWSTCATAHDSINVVWLIGFYYLLQLLQVTPVMGSISTRTIVHYR